MASEEPLSTSAPRPGIFRSGGGGGSGGYENQTWMPTIGVMFLTTNSIIAVYRSINDVWTVMFVVTAYANVVLLFYCMRSMEKTPEMKRSVRMRAAVWALASTLTALFTYRIAIMLPLFLAVIVWLMACVTVFGGFYALLFSSSHREERDLCNKGAEAC